MSLEFNKIAAAILLTGIIGIVTGKVTNFLYKPEFVPQVKGLHIDGAEVTDNSAATEVKKVVFDDDYVATLLAVANADRGKDLAKKCTTCHTFEDGGPNRVGPNLYGIVGAPHAHRADFNYSDAVKSRHTEKWDYTNLFKLVYSPREYSPGTKMTFIGIKKPEEIADVVAYLRTLSPSPLPLPTPPKKVDAPAAAAPAKTAAPVTPVAPVKKK